MISWATLAIEFSRTRVTVPSQASVHAGEHKSTLKRDLSRIQHLCIPLLCPVTRGINLTVLVSFSINDSLQPKSGEDGTVSMLIKASLVCFLGVGIETQRIKV